MNKSNNKNVVNTNDSFAKSSFTLTFIIEILGLDVWHDCNEGWLDLGTCYQAIKIQYQLYPGQNFDVDVLIWPHVVKIWCGTQCGWVRTWQFLERRWFAFSIRHAFAVRVAEFCNCVATITPIFGIGAVSANAKNDKNAEVYLPAIKFGEKRYFAGVVEKEESLNDFIHSLIWSYVEKFIPASIMDGLFDTPTVVSALLDVRHQDAVISKVQERILSSVMSEEEIDQEFEVQKTKDRRDSKQAKDKKKVPEVPKVKFEINLSGDDILAGVGRITQFEVVGDRPAELGELMVLISTNNLPAHDDLPIVFVNVETLTDVPIEAFKKSRISHLYTRWKIGEEVHESALQQIRSKTVVNFNDHHAVPLEHLSASNITSTFLDSLFEIELRGIHQLENTNSTKFFSQDTAVESITDTQDYGIAITKIDASALSKGINGLVRGEYSLFPLERGITSLGRERICTNDINGIRRPVENDVIVQPYVILQAQMTLEISIGFVGCKPKEPSVAFSRLYCFVDDSNTVIALLQKITEINDEVLASSERDNLLTGFVLDTGDKAIFYVEGRRHGDILKIWHMAEDYYSSMKTLFSSSYIYATRLYPDMAISPMPFIILKMYAPLPLLLVCPPLYVRPSLPLPARTAMLKFGRLLANKLRSTPCRSEMPSSEELTSFRLELCSSPRPGCVIEADINLVPNPSQSRNALLENIVKKNNKNDF